MPHSVAREWSARMLYICRNTKAAADDAMDAEIRFYKGKHKVRVLSKSRGNWVVEALQAFTDCVDGERVEVMSGERRIVAPNLLFKRASLPPPVKEHVYELKMEKRLKKIVEKEEDKTRKRQ